MQAMDGFTFFYFANIENMKKIIWGLLFMSLFLFSCSREEELNKGYSDNKLMNIAWVSTNIEYNEYNSGNIEERKEYVTIYFLENNIGVYHELVRWKDIYDSGSWEDALLFTYELFENEIKINYKGGGWSNYTFSGNTLRNPGLDSHSEFEAKRNMSMEDYDLIEKFFPTKGKCGTNLTWQYDVETQSLNIKGTGLMYNYEEEGLHGMIMTIRNGI